MNDFADSEGMTYGALQSRLYRARKKLQEERQAISFPDLVPIDEVDWREFSDLASTVQDINERQNSYQKIATVRIDTDRPVALVYSGDWHLGSGYTDHEMWKRDMELILDTDSLYLADLGDDRQNTRNFRDLSVVLSQVLSPANQAEMIRSVVNELTDKEKLVAKIAGNHDVEFDERIFGQAIQSYLLMKMKAPKFRNRGLLKLKVGNQLYTNLLFHKSRFSSFLRAAHGAMREHQLSFPADVVVGAHNHAPAFEIFWRYELAREAGFGFGGEIYLIKVGTYQDDPYGWKYFHGGEQANPTVIYWPDKHKKLVFMRMRDAVDYINLI